MKEAGLDAVLELSDFSNQSIFGVRTFSFGECSLCRVKGPGTLVIR